MPHINMQMEYHVWDAMLKHYQRHMLKLTDIIPSWKTILWTIQNYLLHEFIDKTIVSFATDFDRVLLQLVGTDIVNTMFK